MSVVSSLYALIKRGKEGKNIGLSTGLPKLDKLIGGWQRSRYYCIFGSTSAGKTAITLYSLIYRTLRDNPDKDIKIIYFSLEMGTEILFSKLLGLYAYEEYGVTLSTDDILSQQQTISEEDYKILLKAQTWLTSIEDKFIIYDTGLSARILYKKVIPLLDSWGSWETIGSRKIYVPNNEDGYVFIVVDHISLVRAEEGRKLKDEIDLVSSYLVTLRRRYYVSPVVLMQQNRDSSSMDRRKADLTEPGVNDTKDSGNPPQDCDVLLSVYYPQRDKLNIYRKYRIVGTESNPGIGDRFRSLILSKNRYGVCDKVIGTNFFGEIGLFREMPKGEEIQDYRPYRTIDGYKIKTDVERKDNNTAFKL